MSSEAEDDARFRTLVGVLGRLVREPDLEARLGAKPVDWLQAQGLGIEDAAALAGYGPRRLAVYRKLVRSGLEGALGVQLPRTVRRLGPRLAGDVDRFCVEVLARSHFLRDVPREWVEHARSSWSSDPSLPPHLGDLARHELSGFELCAAPPNASSRPVSTDALDAARPVAFDESVRVYTYDYPVHEIEDVDAPLAARKTTLLGYRDAGHEARWLELSDLAAALTVRLLRQEPLGAAVTLACADAGLPVEPASLGRVATFLGDLAERRILLGTGA